VASASPSSRVIAPPLSAASQAPERAKSEATDDKRTIALRPFTDFVGDDASPAARVALARSDKLATVQALFAERGVTFPPAELLLRGYKHERELEVWASSEPGAPLSHVTTFGVCAASGLLGPKRREGDRQVPEGYYTIEFLHAASDYYLALKVSYPNASDRLLGHPTQPGSDIMIHGRCASIGCLALGDERIQELWVMSEALRVRPIHVHFLPARDRALLHDDPAFADQQSFWENLYQGQELFERTRRPPVVTVERDGRYAFR
jgi:murein L,D-transpeptidase YafK